MSQLPSQAATASLAQGARRNVPVAFAGTELPDVQPSNIGAPGVPGIAALPAPVPDMSAARDLEQALRATQALGGTLIQTGNALNIQKQIEARGKAMSDADAERKRRADEAADVDASALRAIMDSAKLKQRINDGSLDAVVASTDMDTFVASQLAGYEARTPAGNDYYRKAMSNYASDGYVAVRSGMQKKQLATDINGLHARMLMSDPAGPQLPADEEYALLAQRHPYVDRNTFYESWSKGLEAIARAGERDRFDALASTVSDPSMRSLFVDPLRPVLANAVSAMDADRMRSAEMAQKQALESAAPFGTRLSGYRDALAASGIDQETSAWQMSEFLVESMKRASSLEELHAIDVASDGLPESAKANYDSKKNALRKPMSKSYLDAASRDPAMDYGAIRADVEGLVDPDDIAIADERYVQHVVSRRKTAVVTEYLKNNDRVEIEGMLRDAFAKYDPSKPAWQQVQSAIDGDELTSLYSVLESIDKENADRVFVQDVINGSVRIPTPKDGNWAKVLAGSGAVRNGRIGDVGAATAVVLRTQMVPQDLLQAMYSDLSGSKDDKVRALRFLGMVAPVINDPQQAKDIVGGDMNTTDPAANPAIVRAAQSVIPMLATLQRADPSGLISDADSARVLEAFESAKERFQEATPPTFNRTSFENLLVANDISRIGKFSTVDGATNLPTATGVERAIMQESASRLAKRGIGNDAAVELGQIVAARVIREMVPAFGNAGMSKDAIERRIDGEAGAIIEEYHTPTYGGRGIGMPTDKSFAPFAKWDEAAFKARAEGMGLSPDSVVNAWPVTGEGNSWCCLVRDRKQDRKGKVVEQDKFVIVDLPMQEQPVQMTPEDVVRKIDERVEAARQRAANPKPSRAPSWADPNRPNYGPKY